MIGLVNVLLNNILNQSDIKIFSNKTMTVFLIECISVNDVIREKKIMFHKNCNISTDSKILIQIKEEDAFPLDLVCKFLFLI